MLVIRTGGGGQCSLAVYTDLNVGTVPGTVVLVGRVFVR